MTSIITRESSCMAEIIKGSSGLHYVGSVSKGLT